MTTSGVGNGGAANVHNSETQPYAVKTEASRAQFPESPLLGKVANGSQSSLSTTQHQTNTVTTAAAPIEQPPPLSKNALKRLRRQQEWEEGREDRRKCRREKRVDRRDRKREERAELVARGVDPAEFRRKQQSELQGRGGLVPVALVVDCDFEAFMNDKERVSLAGQVTRCYSENRNARYKTHLCVASWRGKLRDRFCNILGNQHKNWKSVSFVEGDFLACANEVRNRVADRGEISSDIIPTSLRRGEVVGAAPAWIKDEKEAFPLLGPEPALDEVHRDVIYLTSESPYTLQRLEPHVIYVVGGLVDKNREKGLCYRRARERGIWTARLPIDQFMVMQSRRVLATNHVVEIMLRWLEYEDWGQAFMAVIPKRKGGKLIGDETEAEIDAEVDAVDVASNDQRPAMAVSKTATAAVTTTIYEADGEASRVQAQEGERLEK